MSNNNKKQFANAKAQCLGQKRDKSSAGRIDPKAVEICAAINALPMYFTTSSCAGRCFLYTGPGIKATKDRLFTRFRVAHDLIQDAVRYFDLSTLESDLTGGGDPLPLPPPTSPQEEWKQRRETDDGEGNDNEEKEAEEEEKRLSHKNNANSDIIWLRFEPFILHVACRSLSAAWSLMNAARPSFKNVGLTTWSKDDVNNSSNNNNETRRMVVAIWGDEGLDMPLVAPDGTTDLTRILGCEWLATLCNERHQRNWSKIDRFVQAMRALSVEDLEEEVEEEIRGLANDLTQVCRRKTPRMSFDVIGDVALLHNSKSSILSNQDNSINQEEQQRIGALILQKNKAIQIVVVRQLNLLGPERAPGEQGLSIIAGVPRNPLITTHCEYGIKCVVDLQRTFFSPRMSSERLRLCQHVTPGERVLVLFCGVAMDALQLAGRTQASEVLAIELNPVAVECARRGHRMLERNRAVKEQGAAERLKIVEGNVLEILPTLNRDFYDRVVCPRPKEGVLDGDLGDGSGGEAFLGVILPVMKQNGGECHWYDFCSEPEYPACERSLSMLQRMFVRHGLGVEVLRVLQVGSVAMRQFRICIDFRIHKL